MEYNVEIDSFAGFHNITLSSFGEKVYSYVTGSFRGFLTKVTNKIETLKESGEDIYVSLTGSSSFCSEGKLDQAQRRILIRTLRQVLEEKVESSI
jgi:hypothetical protein